MATIQKQKENPTIEEALSEFYKLKSKYENDYKEKYESLKQVYDAFTNTDTASVEGVYKLATEILEGRKKIKELQEALSSKWATDEDMKEAYNQGAEGYTQSTLTAEQWLEKYKQNH